jgi:uncharacterized protein (TIGR03437 family)
MDFAYNASASRTVAFRPDPGSASERATRFAIRFLLLILGALPLSSQIVIDTFAGGKIRSGVPAQDVALSQINGMAWDTSGNLVFCEASANLIRRLRTDGILETIAGNGATGFSGDGGPALEATLNWPLNPGYDANGNLYFADFDNHRIRRIDTHGVITSVAGDGIPLLPGMDLEGPALARSLNNIIDLAVDSDGNGYFTEVDSDVVRRVTTDGRIEIFAGVEHTDCPSCSDGDGGPARSAKIAGPNLLAVDGSGNLYLGEGVHPRRIRRIAPDGTIAKFAGYGSASSDDGTPAIDAYFNAIAGMAADAAGNVYIIHDPGPMLKNPVPTSIRRIDANGVISTIESSLSISPYGLAADSRGNIAFADSTNLGFARVVREVTAQSTLKTLAGGSPKPAADGTPARDAWFLNPVGMAFNRAGDLYIAESDACLIRKIGANGVLATAAGTGKCGDAAPLRPNTTQDLAPPASISIDSQNRLYVMDTFGNSYVITPDGKISPVSFPPTLGRGKIAIDSKDRAYLLSLSSLVRISPDGKLEVIVSPPSQPGVPPQGFGPTSMRAIGLDPSRNVYFTGTYLGSPSAYVFRVNEDGTFEKLYSGIYNELSLATDSTGTVWLADGRVSIVSTSGISSLGRQDNGYSGDGGPAQSARFNTSLVAFAPNGDLYIIDNNRIRKLTGLGATNAPAIVPSGIVNAVSYTGGAIAPGELVSIFGSNFGTTGLQVNSPENNLIPWGLGRTKVLFDGSPGAITAVTPNQINVFVPYFVQPGQSVNVTVQVDGTASAPVNVPVAKAAPGLSTVNQSGSGQGAILNQDGSVNSSVNPAARGSIVSFFGTGEGLISPPLLSGNLSISTPFSVPTEPVAVMIGGQPTEVTYAGAAPLQPIGVFQINTRIPSTVAQGSAAVSVSVGGIPTSRQVTVAVR